MPGGVALSSWILQGAVVLAIAFAPVAALLLIRNSIGALNAAAWLVLWGALIIAGEHANFAVALSIALADAPGLSDHAQFHFFMAGIYTAVAAVLLGVVAWCLLRSGSRAGWFAVLFVFLFGGAFEVVAGTTIFPHGIPPRSIPLGLALYAYIAALGGALVISYRPIFRGRST